MAAYMGASFLSHSNMGLLPETAQSLKGMIEEDSFWDLGIGVSALPC
jgi:hypothetical protein